jgi:hypothetical protein
MATRTLTPTELDALDALRLARMKLGWAFDGAEGADEKSELKRAWIEVDNVITRMEG